MTHQESITFPTVRHGEMRDITADVSAIVKRSGVQTGLCHVFNIGSTACIGTVEFEPGLMRDIPAMLDRIAPPEADYCHEQTWRDGNGHSHVQATLMGPSLTVPICDGELVLGTWQQVFHLECDIKPRTRMVMITISGD